MASRKPIKNTAPVVKSIEVPTETEPLVPQEIKEEESTLITEEEAVITLGDEVPDTDTDIIEDDSKAIITLGDEVPDTDTDTGDFSTVTITNIVSEEPKKEPAKEEPKKEIEEDPSEKQYDMKVLESTAVPVSVYNGNVLLFHGSKVGKDILNIINDGLNVSAVTIHNEGIYDTIVKYVKSGNDVIITKE